METDSSVKNTVVDSKHIHRSADTLIPAGGVNDSIGFLETNAFWQFLWPPPASSVLRRHMEKSDLVECCTSLCILCLSLLSQWAHWNNWLWILWVRTAAGACIFCKLWMTNRWKGFKYGIWVGHNHNTAVLSPFDFLIGLGKSLHSQGEVHTVCVTTVTKWSFI